jgi:hypothetical protein
MPVNTTLPIRKVLIVGGGTSGWMTASYLNKAFGEALDITLLEAPGIKTIGVGEATVPNLQKVFFDFLEVPEKEWMTEVNGSFKIAIKFVNWRKRDPNGPNNHFYHPFGILPSVDGVPLPQYWFQATQGKGKGVDYSCFREPPLMDAKRAPRFLDGTRAVPYAWHFDAHLLADFLERWATARGVKHVLDQVKEVKLSPDGGVASVETVEGHSFSADLFVDCTGFRSLLLGDVLGEPFIDMSDQLLCDRAIAAAMPHDDETYGIEPCSTSHAMKAGWVWKIPMLGRTGSGYVYSSHFASEDSAAKEFLDHWGLNEGDVKLNRIRFCTGRHRRAWVKNCVSIGLASCFLEPMESTGIYFITAAIYQLTKYFPTSGFNPTVVDQFNREIEFMYDDCKDFIQAHYFNSDRDDSAFWLANKNELKLSDDIRHKIELYKAGLPVNPPISTEEDYYGSFDIEFHNFWTNGSYYCIFSGMGLLPDEPYAWLSYRLDSVNKARQVMARIEAQQADLLERLPSNYAFLRNLHAEKNSAAKSPVLEMAWGRSVRPG